MYYSNVLDLIGNTPLMSLEQTTGLQIYAKAEFLNPGGSIKDRIALNMIEQAEKDGKLHLLNASSIHKKVVLEPMTLYDYMQEHSSQTGIRIIRLQQ